MAKKTKYKHLTLIIKFQIFALKGSEISIAEIAKQVEKDRSTIYREIKRNKGIDGYYFQEEQSKADKRNKQKKCKVKKLNVRSYQNC